MKDSKVKGTKGDATIAITTVYNISGKTTKRDEKGEATRRSSNAVRHAPLTL